MSPALHRTRILAGSVKGLPWRRGDAACGDVLLAPSRVPGAPAVLKLADRKGSHPPLATTTAAMLLAPGDGESFCRSWRLEFPLNWLTRPAWRTPVLDRAATIEKDLKLGCKRLIH